MLTFLALATLVLADGSGLREEPIATTRPGESITWTAFETGTPADAIVPAKDLDGKAWYGEHPPQSFWALRHPGWTPSLLNAIGTPPDLTLDPHLSDLCDIYLGLRSVDPLMTFGIKLGSEPEFTTITAPAATRDHHFNFEFHWKARVPMAGETIVLRALGKPVYLQYLRFVPYAERTQTLRVATDTVTVLREPGRHFAFPGVAKLPSGELLVVCREGDAHVCPRGRIVLTRSADGGRTWSPREVVYDSPSDERDPALLRLADGTLVLSCNTWDSWRADASLRAKYAAETARMERDGWGKYSGCWLLTSTDGGHTWSAPRKAPVFSPHGPVVGEDGALYWVGLEHREGCSVVAIWRTADLGQTWARWSEVSYSPSIDQAESAEAWDEPNLVLLPGGRGVCTIRVDHDGYVRQAYTSDGGKTWTWPKKLTVWGFPQQLCPLPDGRLLMGYGYRRPPYGARACLSADGGRTWDLAHEVVLSHDGGGGDLGYPYSIPLRDGRVFTVFYHNQGAECFLAAASYRP